MRAIMEMQSKIKFLWFVIFLCFVQTNLWSQGPAPQWVNELPMKDGTLYAVGLVNRYYEKKAGEDAADSAARSELSQTLKLNIKTTVQSWSGTIGGAGFIQELEKTIDQDVFESVRGAQVVGRWVDPEGLTYSLVSMPLSGVGTIQNKIVAFAKENSGGKKEAKKIEKLEVSLKGLKDPKSYIRSSKPDWINGLPEEDDAIYALGIAEKFYFYVNGRESAKDKAKAEIAATVKTEVNAILTDWYEVNEGSASYGSQQSFMEEMSNQVSEATLSGTQIVETWYDKSTKWHYALARMSLSKVVGQIQEKAKSKVKDEKALKGLSDKLGKMINRDYLKSKDGLPTWINKLPKDKEAIFAVGIDNGKYFSETQGIEKAKADARTKLAKTVSVTVENITKSWIEIEEKSGDTKGEPLNDYMSSLTKEATDVSLQGSQVLSVYTKREKDGKVTYYALGRLFTGSMISKLKKKASEVMNIPQTKPNETQEQKAKRILSSGREKAAAALERLNAALDKVNQ